jgi:hypothetical protein
MKATLFALRFNELLGRRLILSFTAALAFAGRVTCDPTVLFMRSVSNARIEPPRTQRRQRQVLQIKATLFRGRLE